MHDPLCVAFEIKRPWPKRTQIRAGRGGRYWPPLITVWHREPGGHDSGEICRYSRRWLHVHHWRIQVHPLQDLRRRLLTHCEWCGGRQRKGDPVNVSHRWDGPRGRWWRGEPGMFHHDCSSVERAHRVCLCEEPLCSDFSRTYGPYGRCTRCGKSRAIGATTAILERQRLLATVPTGQRNAAVYQRVCDMVKADEVAA